MVIGNGLLARAFSHFENDDSVIVFASGVSNSGSNDPLQYEREINLLKQYLSTKVCLVYFSTVSIYDSSLKSSLYIKHKKTVEELISNAGINYLIFRLPILIGKTTNPHTLTNHFFHQINTGLPLKIFSKACRYLLDVDDVVTVLNPIIGNKLQHNKIWNVCFENKINVKELVRLMEKTTGKSTEKNLIDKGDCYEVPNKEFLDYLNEIKFKTDEFYNERILLKYYS